MKTVLFLTPEDSRTGSTLILTRFLQWLKSQENLPFKPAVLIRKRMRTQGASTVPPEAFGEFMKFPEPQDLPCRIRALPAVYRLYRACALRKLRSKIEGLNVGLIISNSIVNGEMLQFLSFLECPVWTYSLESSYYLDRLKPEHADDFRKRTSLFAAPSRLAGQALASRLSIPAEKIETLYPPAPLSGAVAGASREEVRSRAGFPADCLLVAACGTISWRKGTDLFIQTARRIREKAKKPVYFLWVGGHHEGAAVPYEILYDIKRAGLEDAVKCTGYVLDAREYLAAVDVFLLTSREEPFGLVCLEAGLEGKPIVCFRGSGGAEEFVEDDAGFCVPYLDTETMAQKTVQLLEEDNLRRRLGERAREKVLQRHTAEPVYQRILKCIHETLDRISGK